MLRRPPVRGVVAAAILAKLAEGYTLIPRWGHAAAFLPEPPTLVIQGGKTNIDGAYTYTSAPNSNETIIIPLGEPFAASSPPPAQLLKANPPGPDYAWHCMAPLGSDDGTWNLMTVGGDGDWETHSDTSADSVWLADLNPSAGTASYTHEPTGWGNQPSRRIYHGCAAPVFGGDVYVTGGMTADGSGTTYNSTYKFNPASKEFTSLPAMPVGLYHHSTVLLGNGTLLNFGGVYMSPETSSPILEPLDRVFTLQTNSADPAWHTVGISGPLPAPRRGCSATLNPDGTVFVYGGADVNFSTVYSDGWILDPNSLSWTQVITASQGPGPRYDHTAIDVGGGQIIVFGGFGPYVAADTNIHLVSVSATTASAVPSFTPVPVAPASGGNSGTGNGNTNGPGGSQGSVNANGSGGTNNNGNGSNPNNPNGGVGNGGDGPGSTGSEVGPGQPGPTKTGNSKENGSGGLTNGRLAGLIAGLGVAVLLGVILFIFARHRYKRKHATGRGENRAYDEKGRNGLLADTEAPVSPHSPSASLPPVITPPSRGKEALAALGVGAAAVGAAAVAAGRKVSGKGVPQGYTELANAPPPIDKDDDEDTHSNAAGGLLGMIRRSTRRIGKGIRLIGVTRSIDDEDDDLPALRRTVNGKRSRHNMLQDEDSRRFSADQRARAFGTISEENDKDWVLESPDRSSWRAAETLLADDHPRPLPMRGGPVPTPPLPSSPHLSIFTSLQVMNPPTPSVFDAFQARQTAAITGPSETTSGATSAAIFGGTAAVTTAAGVAAGAVLRNPFNHSQDSLSPDDAISSRHFSVDHGPASTHNRLPPITTAAPLVLHTNRFSTQSIPLSAASSDERSLADVNEAEISNAQLVSQPSATASLLSRNPSLMSRGTSGGVLFESPPESPRSMRPLQNPVLRQVSLLRRISSGIMNRGRGELPGPSNLSPSPSSLVYVRDPAPQPTDWPLALQAQNSVSSHESTGEGGWSKSTEEFYPLPLGTAQRPSITEVGSIRSMGDMCVMQRELSMSSDEARIERLDTPDLIGLESRSNITSPVTAGPIDRGDIGLRHPTAVLRPTNPGPTPSGSTIATLGSVEREASPPLPTLGTLMPPLFMDMSSHSTPVSPVGGARPEHPRRASGDNYLVALMATTSHSSEHSLGHSQHSHTSSTSLPSPTLPWGAQANSPRNSPGHLVAGLPGSPRVPASPRQLPGSPRQLPASPRMLPGGPRPVLTVTTTSPAPIAPSPLSPSRTEVSGSSSRSSGHTAQTAQTPQTAQASRTQSAAPAASTSDVSLSMSAGTAGTATPTRNLLPASGRYTPLLTPSPQRDSPNRRAVHDMVASINRRGGGLPSLFGPVNRSLSGSPVNAASPTRTYEIARRDPLTVTNPDDARPKSPDVE